MLIYKATNRINGKVYIGQTSQSLSKRISQHKYAAFKDQSKNYHFYNAIKTYGFENFIFEIIEDGILTKEELNQKEIYWIQYYNSYNNGYNSTRGGDGNARRDIDLIERLFKEGLTTKQICRITGYSKGTVLDSYKLLGLTKENQRRVGEATSIRSGKPVEQYSVDGNYIKTWPSVTKCGEAFGNESLISQICLQKPSILSAYGYLFKYADDSRPIQEWVERLKNKKDAGKPKKRIFQLDKEKKIIKKYESAAEAARALNKKDKSNICRAARLKGKAYGYFWQYEE